MKWIRYVFSCAAAMLLFIIQSSAQDIAEMVKARPFEMHGSLNVHSIYINSNSPYLKGGNPLNVIVAGSPVVSIYGFDVPLSFIWSPNSGSQFQQPFNQFSISPRYKWLTVHLGAKNLSYNPFTLAGHTINGAGFDITPGKFRFGVMYGRFSQATVIDTITQSLQSVSFDRKGIAAHIGLGGTRTFIDFSAISARDDSASLNLLPSQVYKLYGQKVMPAENIALGVSARVSFSRAFYWEGDGGVSIYTRDLTNTTKITNNAVADALQNIIHINATSEYYKAFQTGVGYQAKNWGLKLKYQYIDPGYRTMGAYYINNDVQNITIAPSVFLFKRRVNIAASIGVQNDNLNKLKLQQSSRLISNVSLNAMFSQRFNLSANFSNYNMSQAPGATRIADTLRITQVNRNFSITPLYSIQNNRKSHTIILALNANNINDFNNTYQPGQQSRLLNTYLAFLSYKIGFLTTGTGVQAGLNYNKTEGDGLADDNKGFTAGLDQRLFKKKMNIGVTGSFFTGTRNSNNTQTVNASFLLMYRVARHQAFNVNAYLNTTKISSSAAITNNSNFRAEAGYTYQF